MSKFLLSKNMAQKFSTEVRKAPENKEYVKVFFLDNHDISEYKALLETCNEVKKVNITPSTSIAHKGDTLTVYPKPMIDGKTLENSVSVLLDKYLSGVHEETIEIVSKVHFNAIESKILFALDEAKATIDLCIAWFTNDKLRDKLLEKQNEGCVVRVIRYKDGANKSKGVDLAGIEHIEIRGERHGIMHRKFCIIDNQTVLDGSYNWTTNAETKNDEDINVNRKSLDLASSYTKEFNRMWNNNIEKDIRH